MNTEIVDVKISRRGETKEKFLLAAHDLCSPIHDIIQEFGWPKYYDSDILHDFLEIGNDCRDADAFGETSYDFIMFVGEYGSIFRHGNYMYSPVDKTHANIVIVVSMSRQENNRILVEMGYLSGDDVPLCGNTTFKLVEGE